MANLTQERLKELLSYDPATGIFAWKTRRNQLSGIGQQAGTIHARGYRKIIIDGRSYWASRLAWLYMTGRWPKSEIDHKNRIRLDDRFSNLREATPQQNSFNRVRKNTTGVPNVHARKHGHMNYEVVFWDSPKKCVTYRFKTLEEATMARDRIAKERHGDFCSA
jgi:HNH endonuclease